MYTGYSLVDGMLDDTFLIRQSVQGLWQIVRQLLLIKVGVILAIQFLQVFDFFNITFTDVRSQIEVKSGNSLSAMHFVLSRFQ